MKVDVDRWRFIFTNKGLKLPTATSICMDIGILNKYFNNISSNLKLITTKMNKQAVVEIMPSLLTGLIFGEIWKD